MNEFIRSSANQAFFDDEATSLLRAVRRRRVFALLIDCIVLAILNVAIAVAIFFFGLLTLGLGWGLYFVMWPVVHLVYVAFTLGGPDAATPGMRMLGIEMRLLDADRPGPAVAIAHAVLFYISMLSGLAILGSFAMSMVGPRKRLLHDLLLGTVVIDSAELHRLGY